MKSMNEKLNIMRKRLRNRNARVMIIGLGSVGNYLLNDLLSASDEKLELCVVGRDRKKMQSDVNIARVAAAIRRQNRSKVSVISGVDLENVSATAEAIRTFQPDIIVNSSRVYPGLKYGSISWAAVRSYGIWAPLAVRLIRNIMEAYELAGSDAVVVNTSYSDAVIPWLKTAGRAYPDFGSGNINHLLPRMKFAIAETKHMEDDWNIDITMAASHFHDVVISKEGQSEGVQLPLDIRYQGKKVDMDPDELYAKCSIPMPADAKRNRMNASSNYEIIMSVLDVVRKGSKIKLHSPGVFGEIGGYPVLLDGSGTQVQACIYEERFGLDEMRKKNRESIYLDGIADVSGGVLFYTDELIQKSRRAFGVSLPEKVDLKDIDRTAQMLVEEIIKPQIAARA